VPRRGRKTVMIGTGAGKVEGLTRAGKFGGSSYGVCRVPGIHNASKCRRRDARSNSMEYAAPLQTTALTRLLAYDDKAQASQEGGTANFARVSIGGDCSDPRHEWFLI
jgi:hypothetical protein